MSLPYESPSEDLAAELDEVRRDAVAVLQHLERGINAPLPKVFPRKLLTEIVASLIEIPNGTAHGSRETLLYAHVKLRTIRGDHIRVDQSSDIMDPEAPQPLRGEPLDDRLKALISSVSTAIHVANRIGLENLDIEDGEEPTVPVTPNAKELKRQTLQFGKRLSSRRTELDSIAIPGSENVDRLRRRLTDALLLNRLAHSELSSSRIMPIWLSRLGSSLREYPKLIIVAAQGVAVAADIAEWAHDKWSKFNDELFKVGIHALKDVAADIERLGSRLEIARQRQVRALSDGSGLPSEFNMDEVYELILAGISPPESWRPFITELAIESRSFTNLRPLIGLNHLEKLDLFRTSVSDLSPLSGLIKLKDLDVSRTLVASLDAIAPLKNLRRLDVSRTSVTSIEPITSMQSLVRLSLSRTNVSDIHPILKLHNLQHLDLSGVKLQDENLYIIPLLPNLETLDISQTGASAHEWKDRTPNLEILS
jgi:hypothetical protein